MTRPEDGQLYVYQELAYEQIDEDTWLAEAQTASHAHLQKLLKEDRVRNALRVVDGVDKHHFQQKTHGQTHCGACSGAKLFVPWPCDVVMFSNRIRRILLGHETA